MGCAGGAGADAVRELAGDAEAKAEARAGADDEMVPGGLRGPARRSDKGVGFVVWRDGGMPSQTRGRQETQYEYRRVRVDRFLLKRGATKGTGDGGVASSAVKMSTRVRWERLRARLQGSVRRRRPGHGRRAMRKYAGMVVVVVVFLGWAVNLPGSVRKRDDGGAGSVRVWVEGEGGRVVEGLKLTGRKIDVICDVRGRGRGREERGKRKERERKEGRKER